MYSNIKIGNIDKLWERLRYESSEAHTIGQGRRLSFWDGNAVYTSYVGTQANTFYKTHDSTEHK